ncbi:MAG TPA: hypothetical protein VF171_06555 [Trueperaceae bacterium]
MTGIPSMQDAMLAGIPGRGIITRLRNAQDDVVEANGTFIPGGPNLELGALRMAQQSDEPVRYEGLITDGQGQGERDELAITDVRITRIQEYTDLEGQQRLLINFLGSRPHGERQTSRRRQRDPGRVPLPPAGPNERIRKEVGQ